MSRLRFPLKDHLQDPADEEAVCRIAEAIDSRTRPRRRQRLLPLVLVGATAVAAVVVASSLIRRDAGPLLFADGRELVAIDAGGTAKEIALSDGSRIRLSAETRFEPLQSSSTSFSAIVTGGRADFEVRPGGRRQWVIECGLASVEVLGTAFACEREPGRLRVAVRHGVVLVRGELVPDRARRVEAGETLEVVEDAPYAGPVGGTLDLPTAPPDLGASVPAAPEAALGPAVSEGGNPRSRPSAGRTWRELARHGRNGEAYAALGAEGLRRESRKLGVHDLLALADVARLSGHPADAVVPLGRILAEFPSDAQAPLAAFALGRLELDSLGHAQAAVAAFPKALALGIPRSLREDVTARLVEAHARSGNAGEARRVADAYLAEFPSGRHARAIEGWLRLR